MTSKKATVSKSTKLRSFVVNALALANKTEDEIQEEAFTEFCENAIIDVKLTIGTIETGDIPRLNMELEQANNKLAKAKASFEKTRFTIASSTEQYISARENALDQIESIENTINCITSNISTKEAELALYKEILDDLN